jgi:hypothetical protein
MNDYSRNLKGIPCIFKSATFYKPKASEKDRTFIPESGPGLDPTPNTRRTIKGYWQADKMRDTVESYSFEAIIVNGEKIKAPITAFTGDEPKPEPVVASEENTEPEPQKKVRRKR